MTYGVLEGRPVVVVVGGDLWVCDVSQISRTTVKPYSSSSPISPGLWDVACTRLDGRLVAVTGGYDCEVLTWDVATAGWLGGPLCGHTGVIRSVVCGVLNGRPIAVTGSEDQTVRLWDLELGEQIGRPLVGHTGEVWAVTYGVVDGRPVVVSGSRDRTVRLWDLDRPDPRGTPLLGHSDWVEGVALATVAGRPVAVSGGDDVRVWDLRTRRQVGPPLFDGRDNRHISSLACGTLHGRPVVLAVTNAMYRTSVRVWDLEEHRRIGTNAPARYAAELPTSWTDPTTGDVYDLTRDLIDADGDRWEIVDYDGFEPIVCPHPPDPQTTLSIADAHTEYGFDEVVIPGPRRRNIRRSTHSVRRQYFEFRVLDDDRVLSAEQLAKLTDRYPEAKFSPTRMVWDLDPDDDDDVGLLLNGHERDELLCSHFGAFLEFQARGLRYLMFRLPAAQLNLDAISLYVTEDYDGLSAKVRDSSLLLGFGHFEEDGELAHWRERPETWLKPLLPLRADLAGGNLSAAYLGWLKAVQETDNRDDLQPPPRPTTFHGMSPHLKKLATLLHLNRWARKRLGPDRPATG